MQEIYIIKLYRNLHSYFVFLTWSDDMADDAVVVDASDMTIEEVVRKFMDLYKEKSAK